MRIYIYGLAAWGSNSPSSSSEQAGEALAHINMQLFCIYATRHAHSQSLPPFAPWALYDITLPRYFIYFFNIYSMASRAAGDVYDTCDFWATATASNWQQKDGMGGGGIARQQGKRGVSGNIMCVAGIGPHIVLCDIFICWFACNLFIFMCIICIWQIFMMPTKRHSLPACQLRCCNISNSNKPKQKREEATDWSMNNNNKWMYNVLDSK